MFKINIKSLLVSLTLVGATVGVLAPLLTPAMVAAQPTSTTGIQTKKGDCTVSNYQQLNSSNCGIIAYIVVLTNIVSALVGIIIVCSIIFAGIQYSMAKADPQAVASARQRIYNSIMALVIYIFMFAFMQWAVPGGVF